MTATRRKPRTTRKHRIVRTKGQRIAWTNTSHIPDDQIVEAIRFVAAHADLDGVVVHCKHAGDYRRTYGRAYNGIPSIANLDGLDLADDDWQYLIVFTDQGHNHMRARTINTLAHEAKHVEQYRRRARPSEPPCQAFGAWVAERWEGVGQLPLTPA